MKYQVVYSSNTGNTEKVAKAIFSAIPGFEKDIVRFEEQIIPVDADVYFVGFGIHKGACPMILLDFLSELHQKKIVIFGTCGLGSDEPYYRCLEDEVKAWIADDSEWIGSFMCQGKMPINVRNKYVEMLGQGNDPKIEKMIHNFDLAMTHPDNNDLQNATAFVEKMIRKIKEY